MFTFFKRQTKTEKLKSKYTRLLEDAYKLSTVNRRMSDAKLLEANEVLNEINKLEQ